jgi:hypothetical protein
MLPGHAFQQVHHFGRREVTVAAHHDLDRGPVATDATDATDDVTQDLFGLPRPMAACRGAAATVRAGRSSPRRSSLTDPDSRSMATSGRGSGVVGYQVAVDKKHHLIVTHEVTNDGSDRAQLANIACQAKQVLGVDEVEVVADRGAGIVVTLPKPMTSGIEAKGLFGKQDFRYVAEEDVYVCPAGEKLAYHHTNEENGLVLRRYWTNACRSCAIKQRCTDCHSAEEGAKDAGDRQTPGKADFTTLTHVCCVAAHGDRRDFSTGVMASRRMAAALKISLVLLTKF